MKIEITIPKLRFIPILAIALFLAWSIFFIFQTSFIAIDGHRYFSLIDDAMVSMRYAWNLAHGIGLGWNVGEHMEGYMNPFIMAIIRFVESTLFNQPFHTLEIPTGLVWGMGEHIEGYSNLLMTLIMSAATALFDKNMAVLVIQILGMPTVLGVAWLTRQIALRLHAGNTLLADLAFIGILFYLPLSYWSLFGMESGLLTLLVLTGFLFALLWLENKQPKHLWLASAFLGLAFLTRNDSLLLAGLVFGYLLYKTGGAGQKRAEWLPVLYALLFYGVFVAGQEIFRLCYYGQFVPNTYLLKVTGIPLSFKLRWGLDYVWPFLAQSAILLGVAWIGVIRDRKNVVLILFLGMLLAYQVSVGGDSSGLWRILLPGMPFVFILAASGLIAISQWLQARFQLPQTFVALPLILLILNLLIVDAPLLPQIYNGAGQMRQALSNKHAVDVALGINALTTPDASIGVIWAGTIPYYADRTALDFLGRSDWYIASLPAHLDMPLVGYNKYDLQYSIRANQPTYIQDFKWGKENLRPWIVRHYVRANYATAYGDITLILKRADPSVLWDKATLIPWAEETHP